MSENFELGCHGTHVTLRNDRLRRFYRVTNRGQEAAVTAQALMAGAIRRVHGPEDVVTGQDELVVLSIGRDAAAWVGSFIEHHLEMGAKHIFFLDNASVDDTVARASAYDRVTVLSTDLSFRRYEVGIRRWITHRYGRNRWSLYCDADELFDYPGSDRMPIGGLLRYLRTHGYNALTGQMLDLFSEVPFSRLVSRPEDRLKEKYRWYDLTDLRPVRDVYWIRDGDVQNEEIACWFGGIRKRFFRDACLLLTKHPLVFDDGSFGVYSYDGHFMSRARVADISAALLHYKYIGSLPSRVQQTVTGAWHHKVEALYGGLADVLRENPDLCLKLDTAVEYAGADDLVDRGFLVTTPQYREWVERFHPAEALRAPASA